MRRNPASPSRARRMRYYGRYVKVARQKRGSSSEGEAQRSTAYQPSSARGYRAKRRPSGTRPSSLHRNTGKPRSEHRVFPALLTFGGAICPAAHH